MPISLREYMFLKGRKLRDLANVLECSYSYLSAILNNKVVPSKRLSMDIKRITGVDIPWSKRKDKVKICHCLEDPRDEAVSEIDLCEQKQPPADAEDTTNSDFFILPESALDD